MPKTPRPKKKTTPARPKHDSRTEPAHQHSATETDDGYISPNNVAERWDMARVSVDRVAEREKFTKFCPGKGKNGSVRYLLKEVIAYENSRLI